MVSSSHLMQQMLLCRLSCSWVSDILCVRQVSKRPGVLWPQKRREKNSCRNKLPMLPERNKTSTEASGQLFFQRVGARLISTPLANHGAESDSVCVLVGIG